MWLADVWEWVGSHISDPLALIGNALTLAGIGVALWQLGRSNKIARHQSWLTLRDLMANYDDIHANLRPRARWHASRDEPHTAEEWAKVETYLGLFEYCNRMIDDKMLNKEHFKRWYKYRLYNLLANPRIVTYKLHDNAKDWSDFLALCRRFGVEIPPRAEKLEPFIY